MKGRIIMTEITYTEVNGYLIPNLTTEQAEVQIGKYGQMRRTFLKQSRPSLYTSLMITGKITEHLLEVQTSATEQIQKIVRKLAQTEGVNEELKAKGDQSKKQESKQTEMEKPVPERIPEKKISVYLPQTPNKPPKIGG